MRNWETKIWVFGGLVALLLILPCRTSMGQERTIYVKLKSKAIVADPKARTSEPALLNLNDLRNQPEVLFIESVKYGVNAKGAQARFSHGKSKFLEGLQKIKLNDEVDVESWLEQVRTYSNVIYAEVEQPIELLLVPNDPNLSNQTYLEKVNAYDAWNVTQGDPSIVVAISDNGTDYSHEDLENKIAYNVSDPVNGIDDDNNGYVDDYLGWDLADNDNDPFGDTPNSNPSHGTLVAGVAAAHPNNGVGVAGAGYHTTFLPIKVFRSLSGSSSNSYESIIYAADRGCEVINLSWGAAGFRSSALQDMVNYAVLEKDMVVVAAAGNTNADLDFYPASYDYVLSVGMTDINDNKQASATYSYKIDLMAPGGSVYGPANYDTYETRSGSSFAAPQVAAAAALVRDVFPEMNAIQVMEQVRMTSDDIYGVGSNSDYEGKLGKGRLNMYRAVSEFDVAAIRSYNYSFAGPFGELLFRDDTVVVTLNFANILRPLENAKVSISSTSDFVEILNNEIALGHLDEFDSIENVQINIRLKTDAPTDEKIGFRMDYTDASGYEDFEYFEFTTAPAHLEMDNQNIELTVGSDGRLGYATDVLDDGIGLKYNGELRANFMGIMVGNHPDSISDNVINSFEDFTFEDDLVNSQNIKFIKRADADHYSLGTLSDDGADRVHGFLIEQEFLAWDDETDDDYLVCEYRITNTKNFAKTNMKFGLYMDFGIADSTKNFVEWNAANKLAYTRSDDEPDFLVGVALITDQTAIVNAIDLFDQDEDPLDVTNDFTDLLKYNFLNTEKTSAGGVSGYDVAQLVTADMGTFTAYDSEKIAYAIVFGEDLAELIDHVNKAKVKYAAFLSTPPLNMIVGTCEGEDLLLGNSDPLSVYTDALGTDLIDSGTDLNLGSYTEDTDLYFKEITGGYESDIYQMQVSIANPQIDFQATPNILYLDDDPENEVQFQDLSLGATEWSWDFKNDYFSSAKNPRTSFHEEGSYEIDFTSTTAAGCEESMTRTYEVKTRGVAPILEDQTVCEGSAVSVSASNSSSLRIFHSENADEPFFEGASYSIASLTESVTYYVSSSATENESIKVPVILSVDPISAGFDYIQDTLDMSSPTLIRITDESTNASSTTWTINDAQQIGGSSFVYDYEGLNSVVIRMEVESDLGCTASHESEVLLQKSSKGGIASQQICEWEVVNAEPQFGDYFVFYTDENKSKILNKGRTALFGPITKDTSFYISNITDYLESELIEFEINVDEFETKIIADPDSLFFESEKNASFSIDNLDAESTWWSQGDGQQAWVASPTFTYQETGDYLLTAISTNANACVDTATATYRVFQILDVNALKKSLVLFPNPTNRFLHVSGIALGEEVEIVDVSGRSHAFSSYSHPEGELIDTQHLPRGIYFLKGRLGKHSYHVKFVKK